MEHFSHKIICLESGIFIVRRKRLFNRSIVIVYYFHFHVLELRRLIGCASSRLIHVWHHFWNLVYPLLVTVVLVDLIAAELLSSVNFGMNFLTYRIIFVPRAHRQRSFCRTFFMLFWILSIWFSHGKVMEARFILREVLRSDFALLCGHVLCDN